MKNTILWFAVALVILAALSLPLWLTPTPMTVKNFGPADVTKLLAFPLLIALFLERALEVFVNTWRGPKQDDLDRKVQDAEPASLQTAKQAQADYKSNTRRIALWTAFGLGILVSAVGIRTLQSLIQADALGSLPKFQVGTFRLLDVFLTGGLIAGGSEGIHKLTQVYTNFMETTSEKPSKAVNGSSQFPLVSATQF
jgi:hypothetical protein